MTLQTRSVSRIRSGVGLLSVILLPFLVAALLPAKAAPVPARRLVLDVTKAPFKAVGNGLVNDRLAIQAAIDRAAANPAGGEVRLPTRHTFLTGTLELKSNVTLRLMAGSVLQSSLNPEHYPYPVEFGRRFPDSPYAWDDKYFWNYPLIYAGPGTSRVKVLGPGAIRTATVPGAGDDAQLFLSPIGFFQVTDFELASFKTRNTKGYNIQLHSCSRGSIHSLNITAPYTGDDFNCDGISLEGCQNIRVYRCQIVTNDDLIYCWSSWRDPRGRTWWNSDAPQPCKNIVIENNSCRLIGSVEARGFALLAWGGSAPDPEQVTISDVLVRNNTLIAGYPVAVLAEDPFYGGPQAPLRRITITGNRLYAYNGHPWVDFRGATVENPAVSRNLFYRIKIP